MLRLQELASQREDIVHRFEERVRLDRSLENALIVLLGLRDLGTGCTVRNRYQQRCARATALDPIADGRAVGEVGEEDVPATLTQRLLQFVRIGDRVTL